MKSRDPEVSRRCELLAARWAEERAWDRAGREFGDLPWLSLPDSAKWFMGPYHGGERRYVLGDGGAEPEWSGWREACRRWVRDQLVARRPVGEIRERLGEMRATEREYRMEHRLPCRK